MQTSAPFVLPRSAAEGISQTLWDGTFCTMHIKKGTAAAIPPLLMYSFWQSTAAAEKAEILMLSALSQSVHDPAASAETHPHLLSEPRG